MRWFMLMLCAGLAALLGGGCSSSSGTLNNTDNNPGGNPTGRWLGTLADAGTTNPQGAVLVPWNGQGQRVIAYFIYRANNLSVPIAVRPTGIDYFVDSTNLLPGTNVAETTKVTVTLDGKTGIVTKYQAEPGYEATVGTGNNLQLAKTSFAITCRRTPLVPGAPMRYCLATLYIGVDPNAIDDPLGLTDEYRLFFSTPGADSASVTPLPVPQLELPAQSNLPVNGVFTAQTVLPMYLQYVLQLAADDPLFTAAHTVTIPAEVQGTRVQASYTTGQMAANPVLRGARQIFWRIGVRVTGEPLPVAEWDTSCANWVCSESRTFTLNAPPDPPVN